MKPRPTLRIATSSDPPTSIDMSEAIDGLANECKAAQPAVVLMAWESADGESHCTITIRSIPDANSLRRGLVDLVFKILFPKEDPIAEGE